MAEIPAGGSRPGVVPPSMRGTLEGKKLEQQYAKERVDVARKALAKEELAKAKAEVDAKAKPAASAKYKEK